MIKAREKQRKITLPRRLLGIRRNFANCSKGKANTV